MIRIALLLVLLLHSLTAAAEMSGDSTLRWAQGSIGWYYNPQNKPDWLEGAEALAFIQRAAAGWGACGIDLRYMGETDKLPGAMDWLSGGTAIAQQLLRPLPRHRQTSKTL
jgi:hypothetical protein